MALQAISLGPKPSLFVSFLSFLLFCYQREQTVLPIRQDILLVCSVSTLLSKRKLETVPPRESGTVPLFGVKSGPHEVVQKITLRWYNF